MTTPSRGSGASGDFIGGLQDAVRQNPVSAALVGMGVLWMFTGGSRITAAAALFPAAAKAAASGAADGLQRTADIAGGAGESLRSFGATVAEGVRDTLSGAAASAGETATRTYETARDAAVGSASEIKSAVSGQNGGSTGAAGVLQQNLKQTFERQPLLLGAIGLAIGAGMAAAAPTTQIESDMAGDAADRVTAQVKDFASTTVDKVKETAERTFEAVKQEAAAQGLTPQAAREGAAAIGAKLKTAAKAAGGSNTRLT